MFNQQWTWALRLAIFSQSSVVSGTSVKRFVSFLLDANVFSLFCSACLRLHQSKLRWLYECFSADKVCVFWINTLSFLCRNAMTNIVFRLVCRNCLEFAPFPSTTRWHKPYNPICSAIIPYGYIHTIDVNGEHVNVQENVIPSIH